MTIRGTYTFGFWSNDGTSIPENYLVSGYGPFWGVTTAGRGLSNAILQNFATQGYYRIQEKIMVNAAAVRSNSGGLFDFEVSASNFSYLQSDQVSPWSAAIPFGGYTQTGRDTVFTGTYWTLFDAKGIVRPPEGLLQGHDISFGVHGDQFHLNNPVWLTTNWTGGSAASTGAAISIAQGTTRTQALWFQDAFKITPDLKLTAGLRGEHWTASDGYNQQAGVNNFGTALTGTIASWLPIYQPNLYSTRFSPKGSLQYSVDDNWTITGSVGMANRFPTVSELYNLSTVAVGGVATNPNPNLRPEVGAQQGTGDRAQARARWNRACVPFRRRSARCDHQPAGLRARLRRGAGANADERRAHPQQRRRSRFPEGQCLLPRASRFSEARPG